MQIMGFRYLVCFLMLCILMSCRHRVSLTDKPNMTLLKANDSTFLALKDTAQSHINLFIDSLKVHGEDTNYQFIVKSDFVENGEHEHMWSQITRYHDGKFLGKFTDSAYLIKNVKPGDSVKFIKQEIEDWVMYDNIRMTEKGNFSDIYLRNKRASSDKSN